MRGVGYQRKANSSLLVRTYLLFAFAAVTAERSRRCKFTELVSHHIFGDVNFDVLTTVVNHERHVDKLGHDRAGSRPGLDRFDASTFGLFLNFEKQLRIDVRAFFATTAHRI